MAPLLGQAAAEMVTDMRTLSSYGAPLDIGRLKMDSIETLPISSSIATLPATPDTVDQIIASMKVTSPEAK